MSFMSNAPQRCEYGEAVFAYQTTIILWYNVARDMTFPSKIRESMPESNSADPMSAIDGKPRPASRFMKAAPRTGAKRRTHCDSTN
jgi:hypothetical protein